MKLISKIIILLFIFLVYTHQELYPFEGKQLDALLDKIVLCPEKVSYKGVKNALYYRDSEEIKSKYNIIYYAPGKTWTQYTKPEKFAGRITITLDRYYFFKNRGDETFTVRKKRHYYSGFDIKTENLKLFHKNYTIIPHNSANIAGRQCAVFEVTSNTCPKPHFKIWADSETGLILKYIRTFENKVRFSCWFDEIEIQPEIDTAVFSLPEGITPSQEYSVPVEYSDISSFSAESDFQSGFPEKLKYGYTFYLGSFHKRKDKKIEHLVYSDGLHKISLFVRNIEDKERKNHREGEIIIKTERGRTVVSKWENDICISLVSDLRKEDMIQIFFSLSKTSP